MNSKFFRASQLRLALILASALAAIPLTNADTLALNPTDDSYIRASQANQGSNNLVLVGDTTTANDFLRAAFAFDLSNPLLAGASINSATLTLTVQATDSSGGGSANETVTIDLHELSSSFTNDGVTWFSRDGTNNWATSGGDFGGVLASVASNAATVTANDELDFSSASLASVAQNAVGTSLYLIAKLDTEDSSARNIFRFYSLSQSSPPVLNIDYTPGAGNDFSTWISSAAFGLDPGDQGFNDDPDGDGQANGVEAFFGTNPGVASGGLTEVSKSGNVVTFQHPNPGTPLDDVTGSYEWATNLESGIWYAADGVDSDGSTTVTAVATPDSPSQNITTVEATIGGSVPAKIFLRAVVTSP